VDNVRINLAMRLWPWHVNWPTRVDNVRINIAMRLVTCCGAGKFAWEVQGCSRGSVVEEEHNKALDQH
jgi:hypothetical protein